MTQDARRKTHDARCTTHDARRKTQDARSSKKQASKQATRMDAAARLSVHCVCNADLGCFESGSMKIASDDVADDETGAILKKDEGREPDSDSIDCGKEGVIGVGKRKGGRGRGRTRDD